jgi:beta-glucosidase
MYPHSFAKQADYASYDMSAPPGRTWRYYTGEALFKFAHGLSLTEFNLSCDGFVPPSATTAGALDCLVTNTGSRDGDEVVFLFASAGADVRAVTKHPVPLRSLVDFQRVTIPKKQSMKVQFVIQPSALELIDENGKPRLYSGTHSFIVSRGHGPESIFNTTATVA